MQDVQQEYEHLLKVQAIVEERGILINMKWKKAVNDLMLSKALLKISTEEQLKQALGHPGNATFYDWVIVSSYYAIFHAAQALLGLKRVKIQDRMHHSTITAFARRYIINHELEEELFFIYEDAENKASGLLEIFEEEKRKRGLFQYHRLSKNNLVPAKESTDNASVFLSAIERILVNRKAI